jgi:hypothetical protein
MGEIYQELGLRPMNPWTQYFEQEEGNAVEQRSRGWGRAVVDKTWTVKMDE